MVFVSINCMKFVCLFVLARANDLLSFFQYFELIERLNLPDSINTLMTSQRFTPWSGILVTEFQSGNFKPKWQHNHGHQLKFSDRILAQSTSLRGSVKESLELLK